MKLTEFEIIKRYFKQPFADLNQFLDSSKCNGAIDLSIGDDCAIFDCPDSQKVVTSTDQFIESIHFFKGLAPDLIAKKALIKSLSDLMAMGASPIGFTLALSTPKQNEKWFQLFSKGLLEIARKYQIPLIGGDLAQSPSIHLSIQVIGSIQLSHALLRSNLKLGDVIFITGEIGLSGYALSQLKNNQKIPQSIAQRIHQLEIPLKFAKAISHLANAGIDVSDGLLQDIFHLIDSSQKGVRLNLLTIEQFVLDAELKKIIDCQKNLNERTQLLKKLINQGDDYQLVFSCKKESVQAIKKIARNYQVKVSEIGEVIEPIEMILEYKKLDEEIIEKLSLVDLKGNQSQEVKGYQHF